MVNQASQNQCVSVESENDEVRVTKKLIRDIQDESVLQQPLSPYEIFIRQRKS